MIASAKSRSARGASHQPVFMNSCLTTSHTCLSCLPSGGTLLFLSDLFIAGRVMIELRRRERGKGSELGRWKRCVRVVSWQGGKSGRVT